VKAQNKDADDNFLSSLSYKEAKLLQRLKDINGKLWYEHGSYHIMFSDSNIEFFVLCDEQQQQRRTKWKQRN